MLALSNLGWAFCGQACLVFSDFPFQPVARKKRNFKERSEKTTIARPEKNYFRFFEIYFRDFRPSTSKIGFDTGEHERGEACPLSVHRSLTR